MLEYADSDEQVISESKIEKILSFTAHDKGFHFFTELDHYTGETATSLEIFAQKLKKINADSIKFHFQRNDYKNWIQTTIEDAELAKQIDYISEKLPVEELRNTLIKTVQDRISQLKLQARFAFLQNNGYENYWQEANATTVSITHSAAHSTTLHIAPKGPLEIIIELIKPPAMTIFLLLSILLSSHQTNSKPQNMNEIQS